MEKGVQPDTIVGIMLERSPEMIIAILGILKAGGAYMPIDPDYPLERINFMLADSNAGVLLTTPKLQVKVKAKVKLITLTSSLKPSASTLTSNSTCQVSPANLAYVIYTSGSTGRPKSVMIEHKSVVNLLFAQQHTYPFKQTDAYLLKTSYVFDVSVTELFGWYMGEGRLVILEKGAEKDPGAILDSIERHRVTHVNFVPSMFNAFTDYLTGEHRNRLAGLKYIFLAGEALLPVLVEKFRDLGTNILLGNIYGPTESTVYASQYSLAEWEGTGPIPIGKPLSNLNLYILDKNGYIQPINIAGELCISGIGLARGYLNQPGLTSEKFVKIEIKAEVEEEEYRSYRSPGSYITHLSYIYKTGDLARWQPDGNIEFLGRIDNQIKIRGIRVEPGEIENALLEIDIIKEAVVIPIEKRGEKYLCAYIVSPGKIKELEPGNILAQKLPRYMVPSYFMQLEKIPLNPSGKPDRNALPIPNFAGEGGYTPPGNALEKKLTEIWSEVLQVEKNRISIETNFFKLGGHSLNATSLAAKIHHTFDVKIPLTEIFQSSTIKQLAQYLEKSIKEKHHSIEPGEKKEYYPLSPGQKRIYVLWRMEPDSLAYNIPVVMEVTGQPVKKQLEYTFKKLIHRHESFRTLIEIVNDEPVQRICDEVEFEIDYDDLTVGDLIHRYPESQELRAKNCIDNFIQPFDLYRAPLLRVGITKIAEEKHLLMIDMSHIISDGVSSGVMAEEFMLLYRGDVLPQLRIQYKDFSRWQKERKNKKELNQQQDYWLREFAGGVPLLNLPVDFTRPAIQKFAGKTSGFEIEMEKTAKLKALALTKESTLYIVLLAIYNILLGKLGGQEEIVVGTPVSGRDHNDIERVIGILVNTLALKNYPAGEKTFNEFLEEVKRSTLKAQENQDYPFENLVENLPINRDTSRNPLFDVMLVMQNMRIPGIKIPGLILVPYEYDMGISKFDLTFHCEESEGKLSFRVEYSTKLFKESTIDGFIGYFKKILCSVIDHPHQRLSGITIISEAEKERVLVDFNRATVQYPGDKTLHRLFREQAERTPHHIALIKQIPISTSGIAKAFGQMQITYCQLNERSNQLAYVLMEKGVQPDTIVGIMLERSPEMIIAILGILKAGGAYMPIDPDYPLERKKFMLDDANAHILLTSSFLTGGSDFEFKGEIFPLDDMGLYSDSGKDAGGGRPPGSVNKAGNPAYIMYTSGSTGRPKGVVVGHRNVVRLVINTNYVELTEKTRILQTGVPVFDAATFEIWGALLNSGQLVLVDKETILEAKRLGQALKRHKINTLWLTSPLFNQLAAENREIFSPLDYLLVGGDVLSPRFINLVRDKNKALKIINGYGPTENTTFSTTFLIDKNFEQAIPIGRPINNSTAFILDRNGRLQPIGIFGELWVGGDGVSKGYLNNPELTAEKFVKVEVKVEEEEYRSYRSHRSYITHLSYIYNTGDLARWLPNGNIEFLGRIDNQVKIRGFRIEPGEIESRLSNHKEIKDVVVVARQQENGDKYLCAYIVPGKKLTASQLREYLTGRLPDYMIPSFFVTLERIPLTGHGKVDRNALPEPETRGIEKNYTAPTNEWEEKLEGLWSKVLGIPKEKIGIEANFFRIGGHSLKATLMVSKIHKEFNVSVPLSEVFRTPTIKELARYTKRAKTDIHASVEPVEKKEYYALSPAQERLYILHRMDVNSTGYNMPGAVSLEEDIEIDKLQGIFRELIVRHESLRTSIEMINDEPRQKIHDQVAFEIEYYDLQVTGESDRCRWKEEQSSNFEGTGRLAPLPVKNFIRPFDLSQAPLLRVGLIKRERGKHILLLDLHHIISDGTSQEILTKELKALYSNWGEELTPLKLQYKDYAGWQHSLQWQKLIKQQQTFWLRWFSPPGQVPVLDLPTDYPRPSIQRFDLGSTVNFVLNPEETKGLRDIAHHNETTLYMVILAVFTILLSKLSGQEDIVIGTPVAGRRHVDIEPIIGIFLNTLAMRNFPEGNQTFSLFLKKVKNRTLAAFENQEYPFEDLVDQLSVQRDTSRNPLFDVMINLLNQAEYPGDFTGDFDNEDIPAQYIRMASKFDLNLKILDLETKLFFSLEYHTQLFKKETVERIIGYFNKIIRSVTRDPQARISVIDIIPEARKKEIISSFNEDMTVQLEPGTLQGRLSDSFQRHGQRTAVEYSAIQVTYEQLDKQSAYIANWIMENGIPPGSFIGIFTGNRLDEILLVTGILKAGCIFAPLDIMLPIKRILGMIREIGLRVIFTDVTNEKRLIDSLGDLNGIKCITADDSFFKRDEGLPGLNSSGRYNSDDPLYLFFTSGTSGTPKAIVGCNKSILHFVNWEIDTFKIDETFRIALVARTGFDPFLRDVFVPLCAGGTVCIPGSDEILLIPDRFASWIENRKINLMHLVPSVFKIIDCNRVKRDSFKNLKYVLLAGEAAPAAELQKWFAAVGERIQFVNMYGPTETTQSKAYYLIKKDDAREPRIPIGKPIPGARLILLDKNMNVCPPGIVGEIYIRTPYRTFGYYKTPGLNKQRFIPNPFGDKRNDKNKNEPGQPGTNIDSDLIYRSGDLGRQLENGDIEIMGRVDRQIKVRGNRIEPGEIEAVLLRHKNISAAVVVGETGKDDDIILCAYTVSGIELSVRELRDYLAGFLPGYMIPSYFVSIDRIPLTHRGKVDLQALPAPGLGETGDTYIAPGNALEEKLVEIWSEVLKIEPGRIGIDNNFFELGGHSLKATIAAAKIHKAFDVKMSLVDMFRYPSIRELSVHINTRTGQDRYLVIPPAEQKTHYPLSPAQKRLYILQQMDEIGTGYHITLALDLIGTIDIHRLEKSFQKLIRRHESLRTSFVMIDDEPAQLIHDRVDFKINQKQDISDFIQPFDLSKAPLLRVGLLELPHTPAAHRHHPRQGTYYSQEGKERKYILVVDMHHIISDAVSRDILIRDFTVLYRGRDLVPLRLQYKDFSQWQNSHKIKKGLEQQKAYWLDTFTGEIPVLNLPTDYQRPQIRSFAGKRIGFALENQWTKALGEMALEEETTLFMVLLAFYSILLSKICSQEDIPVGTVVAGRRHADLEKVIGMFVNTVVIGTWPRGEKRFRDFLKEVMENSTAAFDNQDYPFDELVEQVMANRDTQFNPLFDAAFGFLDNETAGEGAGKNQLPGLVYKVHDYDSGISKFDLSFYGLKNGQQLTFVVEYSTKLFKEETIQRFINYFKEIISIVMENKNIQLKSIHLIHDLYNQKIDMPETGFDF
jgi:amino acid adenylation domain-containing protein